MCIRDRGALPANVVHSQEVICSLGVAQAAKELRRHAAVGPEDVPVVRVEIDSQRTHQSWLLLILLLILHWLALIGVVQLFEFQLRCDALRGRFLPLREIIIRRRFANFGVPTSVPIIAIVDVIQIIIIVPLRLPGRILGIISLLLLSCSCRCIPVFLFLLFL